MSEPAERPAAGDIVVEGARTHNLKDVTVRVPRGRMTVVTGVSGSGKSSLAFDTLYAEGQRRYVESLSTYARQFLERMQRPDVDAVRGVPPAIALEQRNGVRNARSTVGTVTEISDYLRLLFARVGVVSCPRCGVPVSRDTAQAAATALIVGAARPPRAQVIAPVPAGRDARTRREALLRQGHRRLLLAGEVLTLEELEDERLGALRVLPVLVDRLTLGEADRGRLVEALQAAFALGEGKAEVHVEGAPEPRRFDEGFACNRCGTALKPPTPALFSFNSPLGACDTCQGFGRVMGIDMDKVIPDARKSLREGAIVPFQSPSNRECQEDLERTARGRVRLDLPWGTLDEAERRWVLEGDPGYAPGGWRQGQWYGVRGFFRYLETKKYKMHVRVLLARYRGYDRCGACEGTRLRPDALSVRVGGRTIAELDAMPVSALLPFVGELARGLTPQAAATAAPLLPEIASRLEYLDEVGLGYLSLGRQARTLSGGEAQRIALASALGARLTGTLYVLDEPSIGLHPRDSDRLVRVLRRLTTRGNTVVIVEHDPEIMREADHVIDLGPGAGARGGRVIFEGPFDALTRDHRSVTGRHLQARALRPPPVSRPVELPGGAPRLVIEGARAHNLKDVSVELPLGRFTCVTGVSGSGKSTLVVDVLYAQAMRARGQAVDEVGACTAVRGLDALADVVLVDQSPLQRSSRSNPATYLKAMDELRKRFAATRDAERLDLGPGAFSFNVPGGRCEACQGQGTVTLEMHFLADVTVACDACGGRRFKERVLGVRWRDLSILDCLSLTVDEALARFADDDKLVARLQPFADVGLGYLGLGQSTATLSGGESQRLKLAAHLGPGDEGRRGPTLFILDEPTTGLHGADVEVLLAALDRLVDAGHTVVAIEHNLDFIRRADWVIDLGPEGGDGGGQVVAIGPPAEVARARTHTGRALAAAAEPPARRTWLRRRPSEPEPRSL